MVSQIAWLNVSGGPHLALHVIIRAEPVQFLCAVSSFCRLLQLEGNGMYRSEPGTATIPHLIMQTCYILIPLSGT